jgi:hypothetical protein
MKKETMFGNNNQNADTIQWGCTTLLSLGYSLQNNEPQVVQNTPWSCVIRFKTSNGLVYLKQTPAQLALEARITKMLFEECNASVPYIIANNANLNCFMMKDAGTPLRERLKQKFDVSLYCKAIEQFTVMQITTMDHVQTFLDIGVPDWRIDKMLALYNQLLLEKDLLIADGLTVTEINKLKVLRTKITHLCQVLSDSSIKDTLVQCDFHDNNILIDNSSKVVTFCDLGEIVISHPFFSLIGCLKQARKHYGITEVDEQYQQLLNACLNRYMNIYPKKDVLDAFKSAEKLWVIYESLCQYLLMKACGQENIRSFQHKKLSSALRSFIAQHKEL